MPSVICCFTATRADYSRQKSVFQAIQDHPDLELQVVACGQHNLDKHGLTIEQIREDGFPLAASLHTMVEGETPKTMSKTVALTQIEMTEVLDRMRPDFVFLPGDRYEVLGAATAVTMLNLRIAHLQGGERSGNVDEVVRHALTKMAHLHFPANEESRQRIIRMGEDPQTVFNVGCPSVDLLLSAPDIPRSLLIEVLEKSGIQFPFWQPKEPFALVVLHPVTSEYGQGFEQTKAVSEAVASTGLQTIWLWPNSDAGARDIVKGIKHFEKEKGGLGIRLYKLANLRMEIFVNVMRHAACMIGNSSAGIREACYFGTPVVNIGTRQSDRLRTSNIIDVEPEAEKMKEAIKFQIDHGRYPVEMPYGKGGSGKQIAEILARSMGIGQQKSNFY